MATPVVHVSIGIIIASVSLVVGSRKYSFPSHLRYFFFAVLFACLPDLDLVVSYIFTGDVRTFHFGVSHSLSFALLSGLCVYARYGISAGIWAGILVLSHVLVDSLTGPHLGFSPAVGIQPLLPISEWVFVSEVTLFHGVDHKFWWSQYNLTRVFIDLLVFSPPAMAMYYLAMRTANAQALSRYRGKID